jgi:N-acetylmuramic acid 6-phosphate (MurNAc-6-P) etherase
VDRSEAALVLGAVALVPAIFTASLPPAAAVASMPDTDGAQARALRTATLTAAVVVVAVATVTRTPSVLGLGGVAIAAQWCLFAPAVAR